LYYLARGAGQVGRISYVPPPILAFTSSTAMPYRVGTPVSWTATVEGAAAPVEYQFWLHSASGQWTSTSYSSSNTFTFTPLQTGTYIVQVWARNAGSTNALDSYRSSGAFAVLPASMTVTALVPNQQLPLAAGAPVTWTVNAVGGTGTAEFRFWLYSLAAGTWTLARDYAASPSWTWTLPQAGQYAIQVWGRSSGSTAAYDAWRGTGNFSVGPAVPAKPTIAVSPELPASAGHVLRWTAATTGGRQPLQYQFWLFSQRTGAWTLEQAWSASNTWNWRPIEAGSYSLQVWVRSAGSSAAWEAWSSSGAITIVPAPITAQGVSALPAFPAAPGTLAQFTAIASSGTPPLQYQFWGLSGSTWTLLRDYGPNRTFAWTLTEGTHAVEAWVRSAGSTAAREAFASTGPFDVANRQPAISQVSVNQTFPLPAWTPIVWTATATGGAAPLEYEFWRLSGGQWHLVQAWSPSNRLQWTPSAADAGTHRFQVWVRATGSTAAYDAWAGFRPVEIVP
jgi:Y_Y_Y domain